MRRFLFSLMINDLHFTYFQTVLQLYQDDGRVIMKKMYSIEPHLHRPPGKETGIYYISVVKIGINENDYNNNNTSVALHQ